MYQLLKELVASWHSELLMCTYFRLLFLCQLPKQITDSYLTSWREVPYFLLFPYQSNKLVRLSGTFLLILLALTVTIGLSLSFGHAEATSMVFASNTTITSDQTIAAGETWTINSGANLTLGPDVRVVNNGLIVNNGTLYLNSAATLENNGMLANENVPRFDFEECIPFCVSGVENQGTLINNGTLNSFGDFFNFANLTNTATGFIGIYDGGHLRNDLFTFHTGIITNYGTLLIQAGMIDNERRSQ